jgi:hypothetical protein
MNYRFVVLYAANPVAISKTAKSCKKKPFLCLLMPDSKSRPRCQMRLQFWSQNCFKKHPGHSHEYLQPQNSTPVIPVFACHIENLHIKFIFEFECNQCHYDAEGPRDLREHKESAHSSHSNVILVPSVVGDVEPNNNNPKILNKEIVTLEVEDASDSSELDVLTF